MGLGQIDQKWQSLGIRLRQPGHSCLTLARTGLTSPCGPYWSIDGRCPGTKPTPVPGIPPEEAVPPVVPDSGFVSSYLKQLIISAKFVATIARAARPHYGVGAEDTSPNVGTKHFKNVDLLVKTSALEAGKINNLGVRLVGLATTYQTAARGLE